MKLHAQLQMAVFSDLLMKDNRYSKYEILNLANKTQEEYLKLLKNKNTNNNNEQTGI